jgi:hypothetical protein
MPGIVKWFRIHVCAWVYAHEGASRRNGSKEKHRSFESKRSTRLIRSNIDEKERESGSNFTH